MFCLYVGAQTKHFDRHFSAPPAVCFPLVENCHHEALMWSRMTQTRACRRTDGVSAIKPDLFHVIGSLKGTDWRKRRERWLNHRSDYVCAFTFSNFKTLKPEMNDKADEHLLLCVIVKVTDSFFSLGLLSDGNICSMLFIVWQCHDTCSTWKHVDHFNTLT